MKKAIGIALLAAFLVSISGCANTERQTTEERTVSESSAMSDEESSGAMESREPEKNRTVSFSDSKESSEESTATAETESSAVETELAASAEETRSPQTESSKSVETQTTPPPQTEQAEEIPAEAPTVEESTPQPAEEPTVPEFDIQPWIDYAAEYAGNVGLNLSPDATACWDNPITAGSHSLYLERDIQSRLNRYSRDGEITDVWIWAEERSDGSYDLYIGYA